MSTESASRFYLRRLAALVLTTCAVLALRLGLWELGHTIHDVTDRLGPGAIAMHLGATVACVLFATLGGAICRWLRPGTFPVLIALAWTLSVLGVRYWDGIPHAIDYDFHGINTIPPSQTFPEFSRFRKPLTYRVNHYGFRGDDFVEGKAPGVVRVVLVGDSFIFGMGVEEGETVKARLEEALRQRGLGDRVEVLNLGLAGTNLPTHVRMIEVAQRELSADVVVMGLFVWNDLAFWDATSERTARVRPSGFSFLSWLLGEESATILATRLLVQHGSEQRSLAVLDAFLPKLRALASRQMPLLVLAYNDAPAVKTRFAGIDNLTFIEAPKDPRLYIPIDGHPSVEGNRQFGKMLMQALSTLPALR